MFLGKSMRNPWIFLGKSETDTETVDGSGTPNLEPTELEPVAVGTGQNRTEPWASSNW